MLFPGDGDIDSPDVSWSCTGFGMFRAWLARAEGLALDEMRGFGGDRPWTEVSTTLTPLLDHPDDEGHLTPMECAAILPRLREIAEQPQKDPSDPVTQRRVDDVRELVAVLHHCVDQNVDLVFG
ncbi:MAG TPA: hypothetical protein VE614_12070 [Streptomyces sp.]|nr:hypothetical protein [Streptomyces sp.]